MNSGYYIFNVIELGALCVSAFRFSKILFFSSFNAWCIFRGDFLFVYKYFLTFGSRLYFTSNSFLLMGH